MNNKIKKFLILYLTAIMIVMNAVPVFAAASKYGEDKPLRTVSKSYYIETNHGAPHKHWMIHANNGVGYLLYDSCMDGMVRSTPTNHSSTVTIDGVKYSLGNYCFPSGQFPSYANVIRKVGGSSSSTTTPTTPTTPTAPTTPKKIPLQKITLNKSSLSLTVGKTSWLSVSYTPSNTTEKKSVTWKSSNTSIATVSGGKVTAKKVGSATITAASGSKTATCKVTVKSASASGSEKKPESVSASGSYKDVSEAYTILNKFRTSKTNQWYWNSDNKKKITVYGLKSIRRDTELEKTAKLRAKEQWTMYYKKGRITHTRPNGSNWSTAYPRKFTHIGENLAWGQTSCSSVILDPYSGWAETNETYSNQGHRRNMLDKRFTKVGIACYMQDGKTCWAMCLGK